MISRRLFQTRFIKRLGLGGAVALLLVTGNIGIVAADLTPDQINTLHAIQGGTKLFNTSDSDTTATCSVNLSSVNLLGSDNIEKAYNFFVQKGLPAKGAAGIVGNLMAESGVNPKSISNGGQTIGIAQWEGSRDDNLRAFAQKAGKPYDDLGVQLDFLWQEANTGYKDVVQHVRDAASAEDAATQWMGPGDNGHNRTGGFENPSTQYAHEDKRRANAAAVFQKFGGGSVGSGGVAVSTGDDSSDGSSCGTQAAYTSSDFPFYSQCDPKWGNKPYAGGNYTICDSGCGPTSMAMIVTALTKQQITPDIMAAYYHQKSFDAGGVTSWGAAPVAAKKYGLTATPLGTNVAKISAALKSGSYVILAGQGGLPFTSAGHFVVIRGLTPDGTQWLLGDPDSPPLHSNTKGWDPAQVMAGVAQDGSASSVYGIRSVAASS